MVIFLFVALLPLGSLTAEGATTTGQQLRAAQREARIAAYNADSERYRAERQVCDARWRKDNAEHCKAMQARRDTCKSNPEQCREDRLTRFSQRFKTADADGSREEAKSALPRLARCFDRTDADRDDQISSEKILAAKAHYEQRRPRRDTPKV